MSEHSFADWFVFAFTCPYNAARKTASAKAGQVFAPLRYIFFLSGIGCTIMVIIPIALLLRRISMQVWWSSGFEINC